MPCNPSANTLNPPYVPPISIPGFGIAISPIQPPLPDGIFEDFPQNILDFINNLTIPWLGGELAPQLDDLTNNILKALSDLFSQIAPFLSLYNFFQALLNMIVCVIEVLCAIPNPWAMISAIIKLFKKCIPPFLNLFPFIALLLAILAILLLLIALIEYILASLLKLIENLLNNLLILGNGVTLQDPDSTAAAAIKIASLLCLMDNLMAVFSAIAVIMSIIDSLARLGGTAICSSSSGCCSDDICPPFIRNNYNGIDGLEGRLIYYKQITPSFPTFWQRDEVWQFVNQDYDADYPFRDIITPQMNTEGEYGGIFWPEDTNYTNETLLRQAPYKVDLTLTSFDPSYFHPADGYGARDFTIKDCIVRTKPYIGVYNQSNNLDVTTNYNGTLQLVGGKVFESNGNPYLVGGEQASIETFIHSNSSSSKPNYDDGYYISDIGFKLKINHPALVDSNLITIGCVPEIAVETTLINASTDFRSAFDKAFGNDPNASLPNIKGAQSCVSAAIERMRNNVSIENVSEQAAVIETCLRGLLDDSVSAFCKFFRATVSPFTSTFSLNTDIQFISRPIEVYVDLRDANGSSMPKNIPFGCDPSQYLKGIVTFGEITDFNYDGYGQFIAYILSDQAGSGELKVAWDENIFSQKINQDNPNLPTQIQELVLPYTFIGVSLADPIPRRDASDISNSGG